MTRVFFQLIFSFSLSSWCFFRRASPLALPSPLLGLFWAIVLCHGSPPNRHLHTSFEGTCPLANSLRTFKRPVVSLSVSSLNLVAAPFPLIPHFPCIAAADPMGGLPQMDTVPGVLWNPLLHPSLHLSTSHLFSPTGFEAALFYDCHIKLLTLPYYRFRNLTIEVALCIAGPATFQLVYALPRGLAFLSPSFPLSSLPDFFPKTPSP